MGKYGYFVLKARLYVFMLEEYTGFRRTDAKNAPLRYESIGAAFLRVFFKMERGEDHDGRFRREL